MSSENLNNQNNKHFDVGIFGWWYTFNYGANISYFALNRAIQTIGKSVVMLWNSSNNFSGADTVQMGFAQRYYYMSDHLTKENLSQYNEICDAFVLGSDQLWNPYLERIAGSEYFLSFAETDKTKLAYAQSFGNYHKLPLDFAARYISLVQNMTKVSVREDFAVETCKSAFGINPEHVCDPVFLIEPQQYDEMIPNTDIDLPSHYVLNFFLEPEDEKVNISRRIRKDLNISNYLNFTDLDHPEQYEKSFAGENVELGSRIENIVYAYKNADFVITDSFHGTCLALIFNKPFISIANVIRGDGRFKSLLAWAKQQNRLIYNEEDLKDIHKQLIDFTETNKIIEESRKLGIEWLREGLDRNSRNHVNATLLKKMCTGCTACKSTCPADAINVERDAWGYYRACVDQDKCINCGKCIKVCPSIQLPENHNSTEPKCFEFVASDDEILLRSSSGGVFEVLARKTLEQNGFIAGASWNEYISVNHIIIDSYSDLKKLQKSKYLQSDLGDCFPKIKEILDSGSQVLFSGTPCQVTGLKSFLHHEYDNLLTVDILCGNAPSALFFKKYCEETYPSGLQSYEFRNKSEYFFGDAYKTLAITKTGEKVFHDGPKEDDYQKVYHKHIMCPFHCEECKYQAFPRVGDISIGDFWGVENFDKELDVHKGVSIVLCNNEKGLNFFNSLPNNLIHVRKEVPLNWMGGNGFSQNEGKNWISPRRNLFYTAILTNSFHDSVSISLKSKGLKAKINEALVDSKYTNKLKELKNVIIWKVFPPALRKPALKLFQKLKLFLAG